MNRYEQHQGDAVSPGPTTEGVPHMNDHINQPVPVTLTIMLACHYATDPSREVGYLWFSKAGENARLWLISQGLIGAGHKATDRGRAWVEALCNMPLPKTKIGPRPAKGVRVRYAYASKPTIFHFVKDGPRKHRRWPSREAAKKYIDGIRGATIPGQQYEIVD